MKRASAWLAGFVPPYALADALDSIESIRSQDELVRKLVAPELEPLSDVRQSET